MKGEVVWVHPFWSQASSMNNDSNYAYLRRVLPAMADERPGWLFVVSWPMRGYGVNWNYVSDGLFDHPRIMRVGWPFDSQMRTGVLSFDPRRLDYIDSRFGPTIYWLHQVESGSQVYGGYRQSFNSRARPSIVAQHHYIIHESLPYSADGLFPRLWQQIGGSIAADAVVLNSQHTARMMSESFSEFLSQEQMKALGEKSVVMPFGLVDGRFDKALADAADPPDKPVVIYNHRFESYKQADVTGEVLSSLRASGREFEVWVTQGRDQRMKQFPVDRLVGHPDQSVYLKNIAVPAINTINSVHETFCISAQDSIALGHLLVAPDGVTFPELVPKGYPYLFQTPQEQRDMLVDILDSWPARYEEWAPRLRKHARDKFTFRTYIGKYALLLDGFAPLWHKSEPKAAVVRALDKFVSTVKSGTYPLEETVKGVQRATGNMEQAMPARRVVRELVERGAELTGWSDKQGDGVAVKF